MAILSSTGITGFFSSAKVTGKQILNKAGKLIPKYEEYFLSGFAGYGWKIWNYRSEKNAEDEELKKYKLEIDSITVRESMTVFELLIQKIRAVKGTLGITQASGKIATVTYDEETGEWLLAVEDEMSFVAHDIIRCQSWKEGALKGYWVEISEIRKIEGIDTLVVPTGEFSGGIGYDTENNKAEYVDKTLNSMTTPAVGDEIIQFGNSKIANRQSAVYIHADEGGQPAIDILFGITGKSFAGCVKTRIGGDIPGGNGAKGFYCENGMIKSMSGNKLTYCIYPNGTAEFGDGSARFAADRSGHIAGGAIAWRWDNVRNKYVCTMEDVVLTWDNLSDTTKENLKGEDAIVYELILSSELFVKHDARRFTPSHVSCDVRKTVGGTSILMTAEDIAADGLTLGWIRDDSGFISMVPGSYVGPDNDCFPLVFYLRQGGVFICCKTVLTAIDGSQGEPGSDANVPDWLQEWDGYATEIGSGYIVTPALFTGKKNPVTGALTGIVQGKECIEIDRKKHSGIFALEDGKPVFSLDPVEKKYLFRGRVEATEGSFSGNISADSGNIGWFRILEGNLTGYDKNNVKRIEFTQNKIPKLDELLYEKPAPLTERAWGGVTVIFEDSGNAKGSDGDFDYNDEDIDSSGDSYNRRFWMYDTYNWDNSGPGKVIFKVPFKLADPGYVTFDIEDSISNPLAVKNNSVEVYDASNRSLGAADYRKLLDAGDYYLKITLSYFSGELPTYGNINLQAEVHINRVTIERVVGCNIIGTDGIISRWSANKYLYFNNDTGFEVRFGNYGIKIDTNGIKKYVNGTWSNY